MRRSDIYWCLGGLVPGLLIAFSTTQKPGFSGNSFEMGQVTGNVLGPVLLAFAIGRLVGWLRQRG